MEEKDNLKGINRDWEEASNNVDPDDYGLPHVTYNPLEKDEHEEDIHEHDDFKERYYEYEERKTSPLLVALIVLLILGGIGFGVWWFQFRDNGSEIITTTQPVETTVTPPVEESPVEAPPVVDEFPMPTVSSTGNMQMISSRSGNYFIVVGSFIDDDLAMDQSKKLNSDGMDTYLIEPTNNRKFYRLAVGNFGTLGEATDKLDELKNTFGQDIWVLKY